MMDLVVPAVVSLTRPDGPSPLSVQQRDQIHIATSGALEQPFVRQQAESSIHEAQQEERG
jgi:hypothetical protein